MTKFTNDEEFFTEGYRRACGLLSECSRPEGFLASPTDKTNYRRIWGRDGVIIGLAALMTGKTKLMETFRHTLETLAEYQGPHGEIPSNVDPQSGRISYGGMTGRVDADLWFIIGCGEYWKVTGDDAFLDDMIPVVEKYTFYWVPGSLTTVVFCTYRPPETGQMNTFTTLIFSMTNCFTCKLCERCASSVSILMSPATMNFPDVSVS
jgi:hypothetical protein